ncbi:MAG TPA: hypothetical protein VM223_01790 [Planctomycetota bacterium]|nr:hypothetical protein [Planctomycetota bacterium]
MADKEKQKTIIEITQELPAGAVVVPREMRLALKERLAAVALVEQRLAEARRDINLAITAATAAGSDVPEAVTTALTAALALLPQNLMGE